MENVEERPLIITSVANLERKLEEASYVPYTDPEGAYIGSGYVEIDTVRLAFVVERDGSRSLGAFSINVIKEEIVVCSTEFESITLLTQRLFDETAVKKYCLITEASSRNAFAVGAVSHDMLFVAIFNGEDLGYFAEVTGYATDAPRFRAIWKHETTIDATYITSFREQITAHAFAISDDFTVHPKETHFDISTVNSDLPVIDDIAISLEHFRRPIGRHARNS